MKQRLLTLLLLTFSFVGNAQKLELGKVTIAELEQKQHSIDTSAVASIIFQKGEVRFEELIGRSVGIKTTVTAKIKIYKTDGFSWANLSIPLSSGTKSLETVSIDEAFTYNLVNGKIVKTKLGKEGVFIEKTNKFINIEKFTFANVKIGSVIEYKYSISSPLQLNLRDWYFQKEIPVDYSEYTTNIPEYFNFKEHQKGYLKPKVMTDMVERSNGFFSNYYSFHKAAQNQPVSSTSFTDYVTKYVLTSVPALKKELFVSNINDFTTAISLELISVRYPNQTTQSISTNWKSVINTIYNNGSFNAEMNKTRYFEDEIKEVINGIIEPYQKISAVLAFVKKKVKWNNYTGFYCSDGVKKAYADGSGNVAEINLMLIAMLRNCGINASPVLLSTRSNGIATYPSISAFDYVIAAAKIANETFLLDATEKYSMPNILPKRDLNWYGRLIDKDSVSEQIDLIPKALSATNNILNFKIGAKNIIEGNLKRQFTNYNAFNFREDYLATSKDTYIENLENKCSNSEISDYERVNDNDLSKPIVESFSFKNDKMLDIIANKIYVSPLLFLGLKQNPFKEEMREYPIDLVFPTSEQFSVNIEIPEGYVVESLPKSINITTGDNIVFFKYLISVNNDTINLLITSSNNEALISPDYYEILKDFYRQMVEKQNEKIVLIKK